MQHVGRVGVGAVVDEAVGEIGEVVDLGAERLEPLAVLGLRRVDRADPLARLGDGAGERQGAIVGGGEDRDVRRSQPRHLPGEDVHIDVGRGEHHLAEMAGEVAIAGDRLLAQSLHRQPAAHRMGEHMHFADAGRRADLLQQRLQRVARGGGVVLVGDVAEQFVLGRPGEQHRDAAEPAVGDDLRGAVARLVERGVEAVDEDEHVAIDADAAGNMRSELGLEFIRIERPLVGENDVLARVGARRTSALRSIRRGGRAGS